MITQGYADDRRDSREGTLSIARERRGKLTRGAPPITIRSLRIENFRSFSQLCKRMDKAGAPLTAHLRGQRERFKAARSRVTCNARMGPKLIKAHRALDEAGEGLIRMAMNELNLSARAYDRILKVARTIADLASGDSVTSEHLGEAIQYRALIATYLASLQAPMDWRPPGIYDSFGKPPRRDCPAGCKDMGKGHRPT